MAADKIKYENSEKVEETKEFIELLMTLTKEEKVQVKGIMVGMQLSREQLAVRTA